MANIKVELDSILTDGMSITIRTPCDCTEIDGLIVYYPNGTETASKTFEFRDSHLNVLTGIGNLFTENASVRFILDTTHNWAFIQNADSNAYLENRLNNLASATHTHAASDITGGTFAGQVAANSNGQDPGSYVVRNSKLSPGQETPAVNGAICWQYE